MTSVAPGRAQRPLPENLLRPKLALSVTVVGPGSVVFRGFAHIERIDRDAADEDDAPAVRLPGGGDHVFGPAHIHLVGECGRTRVVAMFRRQVDDRVPAGGRRRQRLAVTHIAPDTPVGMGRAGGHIEDRNFVSGLQQFADQAGADEAAATCDEEVQEQKAENSKAEITEADFRPEATKVKRAAGSELGWGARDFPAKQARPDTGAPAEVQGCQDQREQSADGPAGSGARAGPDLPGRGKWASLPRTPLPP